MSFSPDSPRILIVLHQEHSSPGRVGRMLRERGFALDIRRPRFGQALPKTLANHAGAIVFGGPMSANDPDDWIKREIDWIGVPLAEKKPFLGICLGGQMLARCLGQRVYAHPEGKTEIGYYPIRPTAACMKAPGGLMPAHVYQWHSEGFDLPYGAALLAEGDDFAAQAFIYGARALALQFHPEVTYAMMCRWTTLAIGRMQTPHARPPHEHLAGWFQYDAAVAQWLDGFLTQWLAPPAAVRSVVAAAAQESRSRGASGRSSFSLAASPAF